MNYRPLQRGSIWQPSRMRQLAAFSLTQFFLFLNFVHYLKSIAVGLLFCEESDYSIHYICDYCTLFSPTGFLQVCELIGMLKPSVLNLLLNGKI